MRKFLDAAAAVHPEGARFDESRRFPICHPDALKALFKRVGSASVQATPIDIATILADFDDYWTPFLGKTGAAPAYLATITGSVREEIRSRLVARLQRGADDQQIAMSARAWAIRGTVV